MKRSFGRVRETSAILASFVVNSVPPLVNPTSYLLFDFLTLYRLSAIFPNREGGAWSPELLWNNNVQRAEVYDPGEVVAISP